MSCKIRNDISRRDFLKTLSAFITGAAAFIGGAPISNAVAAQTKSGPKPPPQKLSRKPISKVIDIHDSNWLKTDGSVDPHVVKKLVHEGMLRLTGKSSLRSAWQEFVSPRETVGIKFNRISGDFTGANQSLLDAIVSGLLAAGVSRERIIAVEAVNVSFENHIKLDFHLGPEIDFGKGKTQLTRFITDQVDVVINVPNLKDHNVAGVTGALKNISHAGGTIMSKPSRFHSNNCTPYIGLINALEPVNSKRRLNIMNALKGVFEGGPGYRDPHLQWRYNGLLISSDPVALDAIELDIIQAARKDRGLPNLFATAKKPIHIAHAADLGLGVADPSLIEHVKIDMGVTPQS